MTDNAKRPLVPKLRFPEFRDAGEWEVKKLIDTADKKVKWSFIGGPFGSNLKSSDYVDNGVRIIQLQNIGDGEFIDDYRIFTSEKKADELLSNNIYPGDIILSKMGDPVGRACLIPDTHNRYVMCSDGIRLVIDENIFSKYFIYLLINSSYFRSLVEKIATGSTRKRIGLDELKNLPILVPKKKEQQKIADCLSSLDELITLETQQLAALKTHKKGLMQQLFPAEGETVPKLRFPEFRDAGEWEVKRLEEISDIKTGPFGSVLHESDYVEIGTPIITVEHLGEIGITEKKVPKVSDFDKLRLSSYILSEGDIVFSRVGSVDRCAIVGSNEDGWLFSGRLLRMRIISSKYFPGFVNHLLKHEPSKTKIRNSAVGQTMPSLNTEILRQISLPLPKLPEQQKIADCLSSLDAHITAQAKKIDLLKTHKKGLMQQLFPAPDEGQ